MSSSPLIQRRRVLQAGVAAGVALLAPSARACEFFTTTLRVTHPWARATRLGSRGAIVSMVFDEVTETDRLIAVSTPVATGAQLGGQGGTRPIDFVIPQGRTSTLSEQGVFVRLVGLRHPLELARAYPLTLEFEKGGKVEADLSIDYA
jgi:copper(I)-binding protein